MNHVMNFFLLLSIVVLTESHLFSEEETNSTPLITVYKTSTCGCCQKWVDHLKDNGFSVTVVVEENLTPIKNKNKIPEELRSCHTGIIDASVVGKKYTIEGHVPAENIHRMLEEKRDVDGLAVAGMPVGSPGMEVGNRKDPYHVHTFKDGKISDIYSSYHQPQSTHNPKKSK